MSKHFSAIKFGFLVVIALVCVGCSASKTDKAVSTVSQPGIDINTSTMTNTVLQYYLPLENLPSQPVIYRNASRFYSMSDFESLIPGKSTNEDIRALFSSDEIQAYMSDYFGTVYVFPATEKDSIYVVTRGTIQAIIQIGSFSPQEFESMLSGSTERPDNSRWIDSTG